jgi:hypothetical protein
VKLSQVHSHLNVIYRAAGIDHINLFRVLFDWLVGLVTKYLSQNLFSCDVIEFTQNIICGHILYLEDTINDDDIKKIGKTEGGGGVRFILAGIRILKAHPAVAEQPDKNYRKTKRNVDAQQARKGRYTQ